MTKMTKRDYFNSLLSLSEVQADETLVSFINHELELLSKKNSSEKKPTAQQVANEAIKQAIVDGMERDHFYTITDIQKNVPECAELSNQKISALVRQLKDDGVVVKTEDKRKSYFSLA